jgi:hypothetical protein
MNASEIEIGHCYTAKVTGKLTTVPGLCYAEYISLTVSTPAGRRGLSAPTGRGVDARPRVQ